MLGFVGDAIDYFFFEDPSDFSILGELPWVLLFLAVLGGVEGALRLVFRTYNTRFKRTEW